jgi:hypothetical protein
MSKPKKVSMINKLVDSETKKTSTCVYITPKFANGKIFHCMWCTLKILTEPLGCPLSIEIRDDNEEKISFVTHGVFCSFNCIKAFIRDHQHDAKFANSLRLLAIMYMLVFKTDVPVTIEPAPSISLLSIYGGNMTDVQYRQSFDKIVYAEKGTLQMFPVTTLFEEEEKFS